MGSVEIYTFQELQKFGVENFLLKNPLNLIFHSPKYISLLETLTNSSHKLLAVIVENEILGLMPFIEKDGPFGKVINSMPYYGSHGGVIADDRHVEQQILEAFLNYCEKQKIVSATVIPSFFNENAALYEEILKPDFIDTRIGQFVSFMDLPQQDNVPDKLMEKFHSKTRGHVRKGIKSGLTYKTDAGKEAFDFLRETHVTNCRAIGIVSKSDVFFRSIPELFAEGKDFKLYTAWHEGRPVAAMLCLYYNKTMEYYCPVIVEESRPLQPLSFLVYNAMIEGVENGYQFWNWGGTAPSAQGVYDFKSRWGTTDKNYNYYTRVFDQELFNLSRAELLEHYPYFFVVPFSKLQK